MPGSILSLAYDTSTGRWIAKLTEAAQIAVGAIVSGKIASGGIGDIHAFSDGFWTATAAARAKFADGFLVSAKIGVGQIGGNLIADNDLLAGKFAANSIQFADINTLQIGSGKIGWSSLQSGKFAADAIQFADINDRQIGSGKIGTRSLLSGVYGAASIASGILAAASVTSGILANGSVSEANLVSGISIDIAELIKEPGLTAMEDISSYSCVYISKNAITSGLVGVARAISGRMPAVGIIALATTSGSLALMNFAGRCFADSTIVSGRRGEIVYVGTSGQMTLTPVSLSGYINQQIAVVTDNANVFLVPNPIMVEMQV